MYEDQVINPQNLKEAIDTAISDLSNLGERSNKWLSRKDIIHILSRNLSEYYGYSLELSEYLLEIFPPHECVEFMDASDQPRPLVIRANTLKTTRKTLMDNLTKRGATVELIDWSKHAIKVTQSTVPIGATPEYLAGHYMLQSAASMNPVMALDPQPGEKLLDLASAPGGKTSYIAQLMKNSGTVIASDLKEMRQKATIANLHRLGVKNTIVTAYDGRKINHVFKGFDRVLLDAPCSGLGVISRDQSVKIQRTVKDIQRMSHLQKELIRAAVDAVDHKSSSGGILVYSTCSVSVEENEQVVDYVLNHRYVKLVETGLEVGKPGFTRHLDKRFHPSLALTRRFYPHVHNMDGFFVAKLKKYKHGVRGADEEDTTEEDEAENEEEDLRVSDHYLDAVNLADDRDVLRNKKAAKMWLSKNSTVTDNTDASASNTSAKYDASGAEEDDAAVTTTTKPTKKNKKRVISTMNELAPAASSTTKDTAAANLQQQQTVNKSTAKSTKLISTTTNNTTKSATNDEIGNASASAKRVKKNDNNNSLMTSIVASTNNNKNSSSNSNKNNVVVADTIMTKTAPKKVLQKVVVPKRSIKALRRTMMELELVQIMHKSHKSDNHHKVVVSNLNEIVQQHLTKEMILEAEESFRLVCDRDGIMTHDLLPLALKSLGFDIKDTTELHLEEDFVIDLDKFLQFVIEISKSKKWGTDEMHEAYDLFDKDGNGSIEPHEVRRVFFRIGENITDAELDDQLREFDIDGDHEMALGEFYKMIENTKGSDFIFEEHD